MMSLFGSSTPDVNQHMGDQIPAEFDPLDAYVNQCGGSKPLRKILIASNGMAAAKAMMSMRQWAHLEAGMGSGTTFTFVAMATREDLDANADFVRLADTFVEVPPGKNVNNYANVDLICKIAKSQNVDAVWPGWGHASENPRLPAKLKEMDIAFIGPHSSVMHVLGDKIAAGILAQTAGVPSIPWSGDGLTGELTKEGTIPEEIFKKACLTSAEEALKCAERIGFPVVLKASEGGGGKGIRMCATKEELEQNFAMVQGEVPGSPIFIMQLCTGARHIEVQIVGDKHGQVVALNGRDCSTQRRFQKIFEEGPPVIVPKDKFKEMERAAQRLTQNIGYVGAGTVEYLYNSATNSFYFLELNPRLQVEHPVTEAITNVNLPATQLQVAMGIPLHRMPQIRSFYGKSPHDKSSGIDFMKQDYVYPKIHCMAARITAENPDDGFKPTSGKIERIKFQSSVACWGYFSVWTHAAIHEFADSQFGHLFARGGDREEARKTLCLALKNLEVVGEIRNPVDYLIELLGTLAFTQNRIDTSWLDGLIREKTVKVKCEQLDVVFYAAVVRAVRTFQARDSELLDALGKHRLGLLGQLKGASSLELEIAFEGSKFAFKVARAAKDAYEFQVAKKSISAQVRVQPDGSFLVTTNGRVMKLSGTEEALGLRLRLQGVGTVLLPTIFDPSELRSDFNGKVIRYLVDEGASVQKGEAYVELEAMKMIMPLKAGAAGKLQQLKSSGSIVQAGELLGRLSLDDPSSVQRLEPFSGSFELQGQGPMDFGGPLNRALLALDGFKPLASPQQLAAALFASQGEVSQEMVGEQVESAKQVLESFLSVERQFAALHEEGLSEDLAVAAVMEKGKDEAERVAAQLRAHCELSSRSELVAATLEALQALPAHHDQTQPPSDTEAPGLTREASQKLLQAVREDGNWRMLAEQLRELAELPASCKGYAQVLLPARRLSQSLDGKPWKARCFLLREALMKEAGHKLAGWQAQAAGCNLLASMFTDDDAAVRAKALEVFVRRCYRTFGVSKESKIKISSSSPGAGAAKWRFRHPGVAVGGDAKGMLSWQGSAKILSDPEALKAFLATDLVLGLEEESVEKEKASQSGRLHLIVLSFDSSGAPLEEFVADVHSQLRSVEAKLRAVGATEVVLVLPRSGSAAAGGPEEPRYATFAERLSWGEVKPLRDLNPTAPCLLEVERLAEQFQLERMLPVSGEADVSEVFLAVPVSEATGRSKVKTVQVRAVSHTRIGFHPKQAAWASKLEGLLLAAVHELECARLSPKAVGSEGRLFLNLTSLTELLPAELYDLLETFIGEFAARHGALLQQLWVDEITLKLRLGSEAKGCESVLRFSASSAAGEYMKCEGLLEEVDASNGAPARWLDLVSKAERELPTLADSNLRAKRAAARRAGSTYAPEFLGLLESALVKQWAEFNRRRSGDAVLATPKELLQGIELVLKPEDGELHEVPRRPGSNDIGMLAWRCLLRTPEFPQGRSIVLIANDVTHQAGSFGVAEDQFFKKATEFARKRGLPRIYIACNSGARVGLVEELMPMLRVQWTDPSDPGKGFEYLYLSEEDYNSLPAGAVLATPVAGIGLKIEAIVGEGLKSISGGIGVENLQGSGLIAGETSRAYSEIFTLSYITGRSVGIGAYLNRLGQRTIQSVDGPMVLTGYSALNKLLGKNVYSSQDQLGGPQVMVPNGITHQLVQNDQEGAEAILRWLSYVPRDAQSAPQAVLPADPPSRAVEFVPSKSPYDPRHMIAGTTTPSGTWLGGFFDEGSFEEYLAGWGKSVVVGRARLGGLPMGVIAVETRNVERRIPADPGNPESREVVEAQAGQVWFPDSAFKTATAIRDFNTGENLPLMIFANWRGFSGGTRDMYGEVLKFGAQIVDALVDYKHPVFIYIPPGGELRGGSWVVVDPAINPDVMEMYADIDSRGGILEPAGIVEVKFRAPQRAEMMHRLDKKVLELNSQLKAAEGNSTLQDELKTQIKKREEQLQPLYTQVACEFADLHDRAGRMKAVGAVQQSLEWRTSREFFYWRLKRCLAEQRLVQDLRAADGRLSTKEAKAAVSSWIQESFRGKESDREIVELLLKSSFHEKVKAAHKAAAKERLQELRAELEELGELSGAKSCLLKCLFPTFGNRSTAAAPVAEAKTQVKGPYPGLLGAVVPAKGI
mmetsp:Transcript_28574/g.51772  ORF Transcript_28574/g.51772 Transcript_28574/m.51772 type:complete len:2160 (-) Transcript_28574:247-6726(-)|eukprot:CAMPEP_0197634556 /NCGR_PEP_ID=MMETSP1338-20131121/10614_1 /TAXON_ID=43686 ORGANISM="Pelagodinium beii, Strain RCC1491" /NCGR_SAMPLE_ID=MMETSP1338 /ASSEMBLY_ACC=CAM_ASM_000754 /LENGTH=2159 /DNA_ID=CAMNT_0043206447 /DNA_START=92 /DNA_END=6571 /DNA_ORIENTATION=-